ncbi:MAG: DNA helicase UvrD [Candidatus Sungbacteria bacterium]|nr:DNA helicase UvrD [Candidatus Sungbacteria bacterium]
MRIIADFHIHSPYARAVSKEMTLENLDYWARLKGITVMGTGDFTHPAWIKEIKSKLEPAEPGLYRIKKQEARSKDSGTRFMLTVEISSIYSKGGKGRRVHNLIFFPSIESAEKFNAALGWQGNLKSDGRPIVGVGSKELLKIALDIDPRCFFVPAHVWTPWFSLFGSMSGFDTVEECFDEYAKYIYALETGLSSDPAMNWRLSALDKYALISNSDSHSLRRIGREANIFDAELSYDGLVSAIKSKDPQKFLSTIEFFPEEGIYHYDGHRNCKTRLTPKETREQKKLCPVCGKPVTVGVMYRVEELADRPEGFRPPDAIPYKNMVPLDEIIAEAFGVASATTKRVQGEYKKLVQEFGGELPILFDVTAGELARHARPEVAEGIMRVREGRLHIEPGYDGLYGKVKIFEDGEREDISKQKSLF